MHKRLNVVGSYGTEQIRKNSNKRNFRQNESFFFFFTFSKFQLFALQKVAHFGTKFHLAKYCSRTVIFFFSATWSNFLSITKNLFDLFKKPLFSRKNYKKGGEL